MRPALLACALSAIALPALAAPLPSASDLAAIAAEVKASEIAFARTMADRKLDKFTDFVAETYPMTGWWSDVMAMTGRSAGKKRKN